MLPRSFSNVSNYYINIIKYDDRDENNDESDSIARLIL